jgi:hypothetical protein
MKDQIKNNELIAEFMGIVYPLLNNSIIINNQLCKAKDLEYHLSWSWLMPVVIRIDNTDTLSSTDEPYVYSFDMVDKGHVTVFDSFNATTVVSVPNDGKYCREAVYQAVVEFIIFYNESKNI